MSEMIEVSLEELNNFIVDTAYCYDCDVEGLSRDLLTNYVILKRPKENDAALATQTPATG